MLQWPLLHALFPKWWQVLKIFWASKCLIQAYQVECPYGDEESHQNEMQLFDTCVLKTTGLTHIALLLTVQYL